MEHISSLVSRTLNGAAGLSTPIPPRTTHPPQSLAALVARFRATEDLDNADVVVPLHDLRMTTEGNLQVPGRGVYAFTDWAKRQLSTLLGIRWDTWFSTSDETERAEEVNRRFHRHGGIVRLRTRRHEETDFAESDGLLRAFVSPTYTPMPDVMIAETLERALGHAAGDVTVFRVNVTDMSTSYVVTVGRPYRPGNSAEVGEVWGGILVRNSDVGFASLLVTLHLTRLLCLNGMVAPVPDAIALKRRHRGVDAPAVFAQLSQGFANLPERLHQGIRRVDASRHVIVPQPLPDVLATLEAAHLPRRLAAPILAAYDEEPHASAFGVAQAITRAAQRMSPEVRVDLERAAGEYLQRLSL